MATGRTLIHAANGMHRAPRQESWARAALLVGVGTAIAPFVVLSFFNHAQNDDFTLALKARELGVFGATAFWFNAWSGRYLSQGLMGASPLFFGSVIAFKLMAALLITFLCASAFAFVTAVVPSRDAVSRWIAALTLVAAHLMQLPAVAETVYWGAGACAYTLGNALLLLLLSIVLHPHFVAPVSPRRPAWALLGAVLAIAAAGTNEITMLYMVGFLALLVLARLYHSKRLDRSTSLVLVVAIAATVVVVLAPGTRNRFAYTRHPHDLSFALQQSFVFGGRYAWSWLTGGPLLPLAALFAPFGAAAWRRTERWVPHPAVALLLFITVYFASFFPSLYSTGVFESRTATLIHLYFAVSLSLCFAIAVFHVNRHSEVEKAFYPNILSGILWLAVIALTVAPDSNLRVAYADLLSGRASQYDRERTARNEIIRACETLECEVPPLSAPPKTIFFFEDARTPADEEAIQGYKDKGFAAFYGKKHIRVAPADSNISAHASGASRASVSVP